jgi:hypothetical protein
MTDAELRIFIYDHVIETGAIPVSDVIAARFGITPAEARESIGALKIGKTVLPHPETGEVWMAGPFASAPSGYELTDGITTWQANCAWDAFGVAEIVGKSLQAHARCPDCNKDIEFRCDPDRPWNPPGAIVHFLVPARHWYDNIGFT